MNELPDANDIALSANERIDELTRQFGEEQRASAAHDAEGDARRASAARKGELGPEWQKIQQKIDLNKTTLADVFSGADESAEAKALSARSRTNLQALGDQLEADDDANDSDPDNPLAQLRSATAELAAAVAAMRAARGEGTVG